MAFYHNCKAPQVVSALWVLGQGAGQHLETPSYPRTWRGAGAGTQNVALVSAGGMENKKDEVTAKRPCRM